MTDIVERLRDGGAMALNPSLVREAADEITRLRAKTDEMAREFAKEYTARDKEITRLRVELAAIKGQKPPDFVTLLKAAEQIVKSKSVWKRFIDGTPLDNDIPVWMATFVQEYQAMPVAPADKDAELTDEQVVACLVKAKCLDTVKLSYDSGPYEVTRPTQAALQLVSALREAMAKGKKE